MNTTSTSIESQNLANAVAQQVPVYSATNDTYGIEAKVTKNASGKHCVILRDTDADTVHPYIKIFDNAEQAIDYANALASSTCPMMPASDTIEDAKKYLIIS